MEFLPKSEWVASVLNRTSVLLTSESRISLVLAACSRCGGRAADEDPATLKELAEARLHEGGCQDRLAKIVHDDFQRQAVLAHEALAALAALSTKDAGASAGDLVYETTLSLVRVQQAVFSELENRGFVKLESTPNNRPSCLLTKRGREYVVENSLYGS